MDLVNIAAAMPVAGVEVELSNSIDPSDQLSLSATACRSVPARRRLASRSASPASPGCSASRSHRSAPQARACHRPSHPPRARSATTAPITARSCEIPEAVPRTSMHSDPLGQAPQASRAVPFEPLYAPQRLTARRPVPLPGARGSSLLGARRLVKTPTERWLFRSWKRTCLRSKGMASEGGVIAIQACTMPPCHRSPLPASHGGSPTGSHQQQQSIRACSSGGQSASLTTTRSQVRALSRPPHRI
jgi:hypothetical protein